MHKAQVAMLSCDRLIRIDSVFGYLRLESNGLTKTKCATILRESHINSTDASHNSVERHSQAKLAAMESSISDRRVMLSSDCLHVFGNRSHPKSPEPMEWPLKNPTKQASLEPIQDIEKQLGVLEPISHFPVGGPMCGDLSNELGR